MISTSFILSTGLKKWMPMNFRGRALAWARPVIGRGEVLLAKKPPGASCGSAPGRAPGDARAHHAGAKDADLGGLEARAACGARLAAADRVQVEEEGVDHVAR